MRILHRAALSLLFVFCGFLVFVLGANYYSVFPTNDSQLYRGALAAAFLIASWLLARREGGRRYAEIAYAFFIATFCFFITSPTGGIRGALLAVLGVPAASTQEAVASKLFEALLVLGTSLILNRLGGGDLGERFSSAGADWG